MKVLVAGASGAIGRQLRTRAVRGRSRGRRARALDVGNRDARGGRARPRRPGRRRRRGGARRRRQHADRDPRAAEPPADAGRVRAHQPAAHRGDPQPARRRRAERGTPDHRPGGGVRLRARRRTGRRGDAALAAATRAVRVLPGGVAGAGGDDHPRGRHRPAARVTSTGPARCSPPTGPSSTTSGRGRYPSPVPGRRCSRSSTSPTWRPPWSPR